MKRQTLPDCMLPDGADPCRGYHELWARETFLIIEEDGSVYAVDSITQEIEEEWSAGICDIIKTDCRGVAWRYCGSSQPWIVVSNREPLPQ